MGDEGDPPKLHRSNCASEQNQADDRRIEPRPPAAFGVLSLVDSGHSFETHTHSSSCWAEARNREHPAGSTGDGRPQKEPDDPGTRAIRKDLTRDSGPSERDL